MAKPKGMELADGFRTETILLPSKSTLIPDTKRLFYGPRVEITEGPCCGELFSGVTEIIEDDDDSPMIIQAKDRYGKYVLVTVHVKPGCDVDQGAEIYLLFIELEFLKDLCK